MIVYLKVLIAGIRLMKMTGPIRAELKVLDVKAHAKEVALVVPGFLARQSLGQQSLFWKSRKGHAVVQVNQEASADGAIVLDVLREIRGNVPRVGSAVSLSGWLGEHPEDFSLGDHFKEITLANRTRAWLFSGSSSKWVIHVHGRRAGMGETLRNIRQFMNLGFSQLTISMETDPRPYGLGKRKSNLGESEWVEIERAVLHAKSSGATQITLFGWSQGAFIIGQFLRNSLHADSVSSVVVDSPLLDYRSTMRMHAVRQGLAGEMGERVIDSIQNDAAVRFLGYKNVNVDAMSLATSGTGRDIPFLVLYSASDGHVETADVHLFAKHNPRTTLVEIVGAKHCRLYNHDQALYKKAISEWLAKHQI